MGFTKKDGEQRTESGIRWGLKDPESGEEAQTRGRPAQILERDGHDSSRVDENAMMMKMMMMMFIVTILAGD